MADSTEFDASSLDLATIEKMTAGLKEEMLRTKQEVDRWVEQQTISIEQLELQHKNNVRECESRIQALKDQEGRIHAKSSTFEDMRKAHHEKIESIMKQVTELREEEARLNPDLREAQVSEKNALVQLEEEEERLKQLTAAQEQDLSNIARALALYRHLGLEFERPATTAGARQEQQGGEGREEGGATSCLRAKFTQVDPRRPAREFALSVEVDAADRYRVAECAPPLDPQLLAQAERDVNATNDFGALLKRARRGFADLAAAEARGGGLAAAAAGGGGLPPPPPPPGAAAGGAAALR